MAYPLVVRRTPVGRDREEFPTVGGVCAKWFCSLKQIEREGPSSRHESRGFAKPPSRCCRAGRFCEKPFGFGKLFYAHELWLAPETPFFQPCRETGTTVDAFLVKVPYKYKLSSQNRMGALGGTVGAGAWPRIDEGPAAPPSAQHGVAEARTGLALDTHADLPRCHTCIAIYKFSI